MCAYRGVIVTMVVDHCVAVVQVDGVGYESFGTNSMIIADGTTSIPLRTVFLADNNPGGQGPPSRSQQMALKTNSLR